jgi:hypothetical protein
VIGLYYDPMKRFAKQHILPPAMGYPAPNWQEAKRHHRAVVSAAGALPKGASLTIFTTENLIGFFADRKDIWSFPDYLSESRYLVLDKGTTEDDFHWTTQATHSLSERDNAVMGEVFQGRQLITGRETAKFVEKLAENLVRRQRIHRIAFEIQDVIVLECLKPAQLAEPRQSYGLTFLTNVFKQTSK